MTKTMQEINYSFFMESDLSQYIGEWIAICENKIIAHSKNLKEVVSKAKEISGEKRFLLARVPSEETMIF